jgi:hypothetical protein
VVKFLWLFFFVLSCRTAPKISDPFMGGGNSIRLEDGAIVYIFADAKAARPILELFPLQGMDEKQIKQILDRTNSVSAALYPRESGRRFQLAAWGNFPAGRAGMAFGMSKDWKKMRSSAGYSYWYSQANALSVVMNASQAYVSASSNAAPIDPVSQALPIPDGFAELRDSAISFWLENPGPVLNQFLKDMGLPLQLPAQRMFVSLFPIPQTSGLFQYEALLKIETPTESQARAFVSLMAMARGFSPPETDGPGFPAAILFANVPVQNGRYLNIKTAPLSEKEITLLFNYFSVYSDKK